MKKTLLDLRGGLIHTLRWKETLIAFANDKVQMRQRHWAKLDWVLEYFREWEFMIYVPND